MLSNPTETYINKLNKHKAHRTLYNNIYDKNTNILDYINLG